MEIDPAYFWANLYLHGIEDDFVSIPFKYAYIFNCKKRKGSKKKNQRNVDI